MNLEDKNNEMNQGDNENELKNDSNEEKNLKKKKIVKIKIC